MYRPEYPRPQFVRSDWLNLNGRWDFQFDDADVGLGQGWQRGHPFDATIEVPFAFQCALSGINVQAFHDVVWYRRDFTVPEAWRGQTILLHFGAVDYRATVWVNGDRVGDHVGGQVGFALDITSWLTWGDETVTVRVEDPSTDETIARGKQFWELTPRSAWYNRSTGIWQTVWLEPVPATRVGGLRLTPHIDAGAIEIQYDLVGPTQGLALELDIRFAGQPVVADRLSVLNPTGSRLVELFGPHIMNYSFHGHGQCWSPESPSLYDLTVSVWRGPQLLDRVESYFGMRQVDTEQARLMLNHRPYYQKLVLDQGFWPESGLTAPSDEAFVADITLSKAMGFNGCRKHQKAEDPRFLYWADRLGYLVWGESGAAPWFAESAVARAMREWPQIVARDYNHPCLIAWVALNESWGVPLIATDARQQAYSLALYHLLHALDNTRPVVSNDGWEHTASDLVTIHNYGHGNPDEQRRFELYAHHLGSRDAVLAPKATQRGVFAQGYQYAGQPIVLSEFGGISFTADQGRGWGYSSVTSPPEFLAAYQRLVEVIRDSSAIFGFCYTQLTDVEQEVNGLLTHDRLPKADPDAIRAINQLVDHLWHP
jgi:beta-galactosidase/beta-glucuronidase